MQLFALLVRARQLPWNAGLAHRLRFSAKPLSYLLPSEPPESAYKPPVGFEFLRPAETRMFGG